MTECPHSPDGALTSSSFASFRSSDRSAAVKVTRRADVTASSGRRTGNPRHPPNDRKCRDGDHDKGIQRVRAVTRRCLDALCQSCGALAALLLVAILVLILAQTIGRLVGIIVPSANELAGFSMGAASFLALAPTFRASGHIRVSLLISRIAGQKRALMEIWALSFALLMVGSLVYFLANDTVLMFQRGRVSPGLLAIPLWIPRAAMAFGTFVLGLVLLNALVDLFCGRPSSYVRTEGVAKPAAEQKSGS